MTMPPPFAPIDTAMAAFCAKHSGLTGRRRERLGELVRILLAALRDGHSCLEVEPSDGELLAAAQTVSSGDPAPLVLAGNRLYLHRTYSYEQRLAERLSALAAESLVGTGVEATLDRFFPPGDRAQAPQRNAARLALTQRLSIITGGPGTGKTTTVVKIVALLLDQGGVSPRIALAAPTGKAAMRLQESVTSQLPGLPPTQGSNRSFPTETCTIHRLLGVRRLSSRFIHDRSNPLPWDVVIVDEASMVDLALMCKLVEALRPGSRLILIGDKDQLASVESGAVLNDCIGALPERVTELRTSWRFDRNLAVFAEAINRGAAATAWDMLATGNDAVALAGDDWLEQAADRYHAYLAAVTAASSVDEYRRLFGLFGSFRVLCALRHGVFGAERYNVRIEQILRRRGFACGSRPWYPGRPVLMTRNDYRLGLYNGDIGLCPPDFRQPGELAVWFEQGPADLRRCLPSQLPACETAWAMTIHKSQGSEFAEVIVVLPEGNHQILCRELLYTAVTRARRRAMICADRVAVQTAVTRRTVRFGGLTDRLKNMISNRSV